MIKKIALTGNIGSGKSTIAKIFQIMGVPVFLADDEAKKNFNNPKIIETLKNTFGIEIIDSLNNIDKKKLARIVFNDKIQLQKLNSIIHPLVFRQFEEWIKFQDTDFVIFESAIIFEYKFECLFDKIITVTAPESERLQRVKTRDNVSETEVTARIKNQMNEKEKEIKSDFVINNSSKNLILPQILEILKLLKNGNK